MKSDYDDYFAPFECGIVKGLENIADALNNVADAIHGLEEVQREKLYPTHLKEGKKMHPNNPFRKLGEESTL